MADRTCHAKPFEFMQCKPKPVFAGTWAAAFIHGYTRKALTQAGFQSAERDRRYRKSRPIPSTELRKDLADKQSVLLGTVGSLRQLGDGMFEMRADMVKLGDELRRDMLGIREDMGKMEQRLERRLTSVRDDLELMLKSELMARPTHFEPLIDEKLHTLSDRVATLEA